MAASQDHETEAVLDSDDAFFAALLAADGAALRDLLTDDFLIVDVLAGQVTSREDMLGAIESGLLRFVEVTRFDEDRTVRQHGTTAVVIGRTRMVMTFGADTMSAKSRYTHVYVHDQHAGWRLLSAQGTPTEQ